MRGNEFLDKMELVKDEYIEAADQMPKRNNKRWIQWGTIVACVCIALIGIFNLLPRNQSNRIQKWNNGYTADFYFKYSKDTINDEMDSKVVFDPDSLPYDETRYFSDERSNFEAEGIIPRIDTHPLYHCYVNYKEDGSVYSIEMSWHRRDSNSIENYSDLTVLVGIEKVEKFSDCDTFEVDAAGNIIEADVTVTERDGIHIIGEGSEKRKKTLTYQNDYGWYQFSGSWNDDYESVVNLLDWFWNHPLDFSKFPIETGDIYTNTTIQETPDAFLEYLPDFSAFGFIEEDTHVSLKNGIPESYEGHYVAHVPEEKVKEHEYSDVMGFTTIHWCITANPDVYDLERSLGDIMKITEEQVMNTFESGKSNFVFTQDGHVVSIYAPCDPYEVWLLIESLQK